ncbi:MAG: membrane-bound lytic murein transglycosylase B [Idiomarina sp. T82-3]|uniref:lytic murein transglycosylase B n=1 Tax=Idiomarina TaxID=135575 RepID=UPI0007920AA6|nr:lytic murein transglycosylase B [Idiomarina sp. T82-3]KXS35993.1 MAG: membrane-bound lytic murein transglycosylase B [Idiomarina sp. T82-3]
MIKSAIITSSIMLAALSGPFASAQTQRTETEAQQRIDAFVSEQSEALGIAPEKLQQWLAKARRNEDVLAAIQKPWEAKPWYQYYPIFLTDKRRAAGVRFWQAHQDELERAAQKFGVPERIIVAIIGIETFYGEYLGKYSVLDTLYTLGFYYPPRSSFFSSELAEYFSLAAEQGWDVTEPVGSYAGAMGYGQFISSSYRHYAVDFDNDGKRDLINNTTDAIGSVANYFAEHRWQAGAPVAYQPEQNQDWAAVASKGMKPDTTIGQLRRQGYQIGSQYADDLAVKVLAFETETGHEYWLGFDNFYSITRYNHSPLYAMVAYQLSEQIASAYEHQNDS